MGVSLTAEDFPVRLTLIPFHKLPNANGHLAIHGETVKFVQALAALVLLLFLATTLNL
jgi:hypothetical protein